MIGTLADWRAYASARGDNTPTEAEDAVATAALVRASDYIRFRYVANFISGYDETFIAPGYDIPLVEIGAYIAAGLELATPGLFSKTFTPAEQKVLTGVGSIRWTVTGKAGGIYAASPVSTLLEALFEPYILDRNRDQFMLRSIGPGACA
jgi:hypothetical protein